MGIVTRYSLYMGYGYFKIIFINIVESKELVLLKYLILFKFIMKYFKNEY